MATNQAFVQFTYPPGAAADFNLDYYLKTHLALLKSRWEGQGLRQCIISVGEKGASYHVQATLIWDSVEVFKDAPFVEEITGDVKNFTSSTPSSTIAEIVSMTNVST